MATLNTSSTATPAAQPTAVNYVFLVAYMVGLSAFGSFVNDMYQPSLPSMMRFFGTTVSTVQLGLTMGMIGLGIGEIILGPCSDKYGRKPVLLASLGLFTIAAVISVFSPTIRFFLICRLFQGAGASGGYFLARSIPADLYGGRELAKTMAVIGAINGIAPASAPVLGALISDRFEWKGVFVVLAIFSSVLLAVSPKLKESLPKERRAKGSLWQTFKIYGVLLRNKSFVIHVLLKGSALGILFAYVSSAPFIVQTHFGFTQTQFGLMMGANSVCAVCGAMTALRFKTLKKAAFVGACGLVAAMAVEAVMLWKVDTFWAYELPMLPVIYTLGIIFTSGNTLAMNEGRSHAGEASALLGIGGYIFGATVAPLVGLGDIFRSTAIAFMTLAVIVLVFATLSRRLPDDIA
jgi:DHA1 family bicyclomycin/chloramphenicol resistance-like MFS transporter